MLAPFSARTLLSSALLLITMTAACAEDGGLVLKVSVDTVRESQLDRTAVGTGTVAAWRELPIKSWRLRTPIREVTSSTDAHIWGHSAQRVEAQHSWTRRASALGQSS